MNEEKKRPGQIILSWWRKHLRPIPDSETGAIRAFRARLRRADRALDVMIERQCVELYEELRNAPGKHSRDPLVLAVLLPVLAHIEAHHQNKIARKFGDGNPAPLSHLRFQKLIRLDDCDTLGNALRRSLPLIDASCNVAALGDDFLRWFSEDKCVSERIQTQWCFDYFGQTLPTTHNNTHHQEGLA